MKYLISILLLSLSGYVMAQNCPEGSNNPDCWPGEQPNWDDRFTVTCEMTDQDGIIRGQFLTGHLDYAFAGSQFAYLNAQLRTWYEDIGELARQAGLDARLVPAPDSPLSQIIQIESDIADR